MAPHYIVLSDSSVEVFMKSPLTGNINSMVLPVSEDQLKAYAADGGATLIQHLLPTCNASQREFVKTGTRVS